ncbi:putative 1,3-beta-glucan synthase [Helianthus anomalus]
MRTQATGNLRESIFDSEVVSSSLVEIAPSLRFCVWLMKLSLATLGLLISVSFFFVLGVIVLNECCFHVDSYCRFLPKC